MSYCRYRCGCPWSSLGGCPHHGEVASALPVYDCSIREPCRQVGRRRALLQRHFWERCAYEIFCELPPPPLTPDYGTEYIEHYVIPGFKPSIYPTEEGPQHREYPLYNDWPRTFYADHINKPSMNQFKRNGSFSKPLHETMDTQFK